MTTQEAAQVESRLKNQLVERFAFAFDTAEGELAFQIVVDVGNRGQSIAFGPRERRDVVVVAVDENLAARVAHAVDQMRERDDRIRSPVAIVTAVQRPL